MSSRAVIAKTVGIFLAVVLGVGVLGVLVRFALLPIFLANRAVSTAQGVVSKTVNSTNVLYQYDWFYHQYQDYKAILAKIRNAQAAEKAYVGTLPASRSKWTYVEQQQVVQFQTVYTGLKYQADDIAAKYNAKSQTLNTRLFKSNHLPATLPLV